MPKIKGTTGDRKRLVLLDAHAIIHRAYHALPEFASSKGEPTGALYGLSMMLFNIIKDFKPDYMIGCFDLPGPTYRHEAFAGYKAKRLKGDDNLIIQLNRAREVFKAFGIPVYDKPSFEADDMLGTIVEKLKDKKDIEIIIATGDMDALQLVNGKDVRVYTLKKGIKDTVVYDEKGVKDRFGFSPMYLPDYKGLRGDPSDNIPGVPGVGEKTGTTLICEYKTIENLYKALRKDAKGVQAKTGISDRMVNILLENEEEAKFSKELGTIRRDAPIDFSLPAKNFKENLNKEALLNLFTTLEFRSLKDRVSNMFGDKGEIIESISVQNEDIGYDPILFQECSVMRWIVDTNFTNPDTDEILSFTGGKTLGEAHAILLEEIKKRNQLKVWEEIEKPLIPVLIRMKELGIKLDVKLSKNLSDTYHTELSKIEKKIYEHAGCEFNINSPKQLGEILFVQMGLKGKRQKKTSTGALSTKESELEKIKDLHPIIAEVLKHRELQKLLSTYIDVLPVMVDEKDRIHTVFLQHGSTTGRMASQHPNLQNIPIKSELGRAIRHIFIADKNYELLAIDYSQIELRIAAFLSGDEKLLEIFRKDEDVHTAVASRVFKVKESEVDREMRRKAKVINFGILYGMGVNALRENLGGTREEAQTFYNAYFETFTTLASYLDKIKAETARKGYTETYFGRRRYVEGINSTLPYVRAIAERAAINAPIQGTEADVVKLAMVKIHEWISKEKLEDDIRILLQVHDELVFEVKKGKSKDYLGKIQKIMESTIDPKEVEGIVLKTEGSVGENWGEMERIVGS